jgi:hypothetical protein
MRSLVGLAVAFGLTGPTASDAVTIVGQARSVTAAVTITSSMEPTRRVLEIATASDLGPFQESVSAQFQSPTQPFGAIGNASQFSRFGTQEPGVPLDAGASGNANAGDQGSRRFADIVASGNSSFEIMFLVDVPLRFELNASIQGRTVEFGVAAASVQLVDEGGNLLAGLGQVARSTESFDLLQTVTGLLAPGTYTLRAEANAFAEGGIVPTFGLIDSRYGLNLLVMPEPGTSSLLMIGLLALAAMRGRVA